MKGTLRQRLERLESVSAPVVDDHGRKELARRLDALAERLSGTRDVLDLAPALAYLVEHYGVRP